MINVIWAMDLNWLIGKDDKLPWHYPKDLAFFKKMTKNKDVIMGDATYYSLKGYYGDKPLPFGKVYVATLKRIFIPDVVMVNDAHTFFQKHKEEIFVIGGAIIYDIAMQYANKLYVTYILDIHEGNKYFPRFDLSNFTLSSKEVVDNLIFAQYDRLIK